METGILQEKTINLTGSETTKQNEIDIGSKDENNRNEIIDDNPKNDIIYPNQVGEKVKRHRRRNSEITEKSFQCPDCEKCYLSGPALTTHRKTKHGYGINGEIKMRGRPPKNNGILENPTVVAQHKFEIFFQNETRKPPSLDQTMNEKTISLDIIKNNLNDIFRQC